MQSRTVLGKAERFQWSQSFAKPGPQSFFSLINIWCWDVLSQKFFLNNGKQRIWRQVLAWKFWLVLTDGWPWTGGCLREARWSAQNRCYLSSLCCTTCAHSVRASCWCFWGKSTAQRDSVLPRSTCILHQICSQALTSLGAPICNKPVKKKKKKSPILENRNPHPSCYRPYSLLAITLEERLIFLSRIQSPPCALLSVPFYALEICGFCFLLYISLSATPNSHPSLTQVKTQQKHP